jgi:hypothetical protein
MVLRRVSACRRLFVLRDSRQRGELRHAVDESSDGWAEVPGERFDGDLGAVLDDVVQQAGLDHLGG